MLKKKGVERVPKVKFGGKSKICQMSVDFSGEIIFKTTGITF